MDNIKDFWDDCHKEGKTESISGFYENGTYFTTFQKTVEFLQIENYIKPRKKVLEVGVGEGHVTKGLFDSDLLVYGADISEIALNKVKNFCHNTYTTKQLNTLPTNFFDLIICNRVVQHIPTDSLIPELKQIIRSLKYTGVFALQFVSNSHDSDTGINYNMSNIVSGTCCRQPKYLESLINQCNGVCKLVYSDDISSGLVHGCHIFHIRKKNVK